MDAIRLFLSGVMYMKGKIAKPQNRTSESNIYDTVLVEKGSSMDITEKKEYSFSGDAGDAVKTVYSVFPGIELVYNNVNVDHFVLGVRKKGNYIEIHHCKEGRMEKKFGEDNLYLMPGDLSISFRNHTMRDYSFPLHHYRGITITVDIDEVPESFTNFLDDVFVKPLDVAKRLCKDKNFFVLRNEKYIEHIFSELYSAPGKWRIGYFKVKILELFIVLNGIDAEEYEVDKNLVPQAKVKLAKQAAGYLAEHMNQHVTIPELARLFNVSDSYLKNAFKDVFGVPVYSYIRMQKMQTAASWLASSDRPIMQIAEECGYSNGSKFTAAFRDVMGETPSDYRKSHSKRSG